MEVENSKKMREKKESEIFYSKAIKAGRRIYYLDVKKSKNEDYYLAITESKKRVTGYDENAQVSYEKHKIFLYKEDFSKFVEGLEDVIDFIKKEQGEPTPREEFVRKDVFTEDKCACKCDGEEPETQIEPKKSFFDKFKF